MTKKKGQNSKPFFFEQIIHKNFSKTLQTPGDEVFFREIAEQLEKVNHFYNERYSKVVQTFNGLKKDVEFYKNVSFSWVNWGLWIFSQKKTQKARVELFEDGSFFALSRRKMP